MFPVRGSTEFCSRSNSTSGRWRNRFPSCSTGSGRGVSVTCGRDNCNSTGRKSASLRPIGQNRCDNVLRKSSNRKRRMNRMIATRFPRSRSPVNESDRTSRVLRANRRELAGSARVHDYNSSSPPRPIREITFATHSEGDNFAVALCELCGLLFKIGFCA